MFLPHGHVGQLTKKSQPYSMVENLSQIPTNRITLGIADILRSRKIVLLLTGEEKEAIVEKFMTQKIKT